ncbi:pentatricopeptide repeat-containing protein at1g06270 [Phtheirospermum japonicum]|uniref:Pentatricopeptide repeat-containing protein at1g06270 n=1 Tax=Phtheirospermum japonicum TaxID=374723 RepID=A0A830D0R1_9LAMI|nr:pentatricopeptide repeat-containing protein at1g06270 [Phtheirospermum japonicum]
MALKPTNFRSLFHTPLTYHAYSQISSTHSSSSQNRTLQQSIRASVESKTYHQIPDLLNASDPSHQNPNPFSFLSTLPNRVHVIDNILQSFIPIRPRSKPRLAYSHLLSHTLQSPNPLPLALAVLQRTLRSGCLPVPQTHLLLSEAFLDRLQKNQTVPTILSEMHSIGYTPDIGTCNYLIQSLCKIDRVREGVRVLRGMSKIGCFPDLDSFGVLISEMSEFRKTGEILEMVREMVSMHGLSPRKETIVKAVGAMRANRDVWRAVEMIEFLEGEGVGVGCSFEKVPSVKDRVLKPCIIIHVLDLIKNLARP